MMGYEILVSIVNTGIAFLLITLSVIMLRINRKKFAFGVVLTVIFTFLSLYYLCLVSFLYPRSLLQKEITHKPQFLSSNIKKEKTVEKERDFTVVIITEDNTFTLAPEGELEMKKGTKFKIEKVIYPSSPDNITADIKGFAGNARTNDLQDIGYWVTYDDMLKHWAIKGEKDKFEVQIKDGKEVIGKVYIKFTD